MEKLYPAIISLSLLSPPAAIVAAIIFYGHHRRHVAPDRCIPAIVYALAIIIIGITAGYFGMIAGIEHACNIPKAGNLCGLWGVFVTGPLSCALAILLIGIAVYVRRPTPKADDSYFADGDDSD